MAGNSMTNDPLTLEEEYEQQRIDALPGDLQDLVALHHMDQLEATPSYIEGQAQDFIALCDAAGIKNEKE